MNVENTEPRQKPILLVEDDPKDVKLILEAFDSFKLINKVAVARDGHECLDYLYRKNQFADVDDPLPCFILLDLKLPSMDGFELLELLKAEPKFARIPIIILTASAYEGDVEQGYKLGVNAYVVKPLDFNHFKETIKKMSIFWLELNKTVY